ncbi:MAG: sulfatase/phosphatase domain-containing protein, partial [Chloroflexota bacterium]
YEHSVRVPSIMRGPAAGARGGGLRSLPADKRVDALTYTPDLFPTLCDLAGIAIPDSVEARSLVPLLTGAEPRIRDTVFAVYKDMQRMVCDGRWKLIRYYRSTHAAPPNPAVPTTPAAGAETGTDRVQLFDLAHDPWELHDLVDDTLQRGHLHRLAGELTGWQQRTGDPMAGVPALPDIAKL